jgi:RES domain-containing protein
VILWHISNYETLDGTGGMLAGGRWHSKGRPIVYCAPDPATALWEVLVHAGELDISDIALTYQYLKIEVPDDVTAETVPVAELPPAWRNDINVSRPLGDRWLASARTALLRVPCVIVPETLNALINPQHPDSSKLRILEVIPYPLDSRLA